MTTHHPTEDVLEQYALHRLSGPALDEIDDHLLVCEACQDQVLKLDQFVASLRKAAPTVPAFQPQPVRQPSAWFRPALAFACATLVCAGFWSTVTLQQTPERALSEATLATMRGEAPDSVTVPAAQRYRLTLDLTGLSAASAYTVSVVDVAGREQWTGAGEVRGDAVQIDIPRPLPAGQYWLRLNAAGELRREYSLRIR